jgi:hypothetical protein
MKLNQLDAAQSSMFTVSLFCFPVLSLVATGQHLCYAVASSTTATT